MEREPYCDYMGRMLQEDWERSDMAEKMWQREIREMQSTVHTLQVRVKTLNERVSELTKQVTNLGGDPQQLELEL